MEKYKLINVVANVIKLSQDMDIIFTDEDRGMYAEQSDGREGLRNVLIDLLVGAFEGSEYQSYAEEIVNALKEPVENDWFDEKAAIKMLNSVTDDNLNWDIIDGDLMLLGPDDYEEEIEVDDTEGLEEQSCDCDDIACSKTSSVKNTINKLKKLYKV